MQTTCPECRTTFRVNQDQLGARRGLVRCGNCNAVFNAYDTLLPELEEAPDQPAAERQIETDTARYGAAMDGESIEPEPAASAMTESGHAEADKHSEPANSPEPWPTTLLPGAPLPLRPSPPPKVEQTPASTIQTDILLQPLSTQMARPPLTWKTVLPWVLAIMLFALLLLQIAYFLRAELVAAAPSTRPALEWLCQPLNCDVPLPRQLTQEAIVSSSLEHDPEQKSRVRLSFLLSNRTGQTQAWPWITLNLSDLREAPVGQQVFQPQTYLPKDLRASDGMPANSEREIRLDLEIGNLMASGYKLRLAYP